MYGSCTHSFISSIFRVSRISSIPSTVSRYNISLCCSRTIQSLRGLRFTRTWVRELTQVHVRTLDQDALERYFKILKRCWDEWVKELPEWEPCLGLAGRFGFCVAGGGVVGGVRVERIDGWIQGTSGGENLSWQGRVIGFEHNDF
jgi:hypothetical protein